MHFMFILRSTSYTWEIKKTECPDLLNRELELTFANDEI